MQRAYDVLIAGAGPAGSVAATLLARQGRRVALLEPHQASGVRVGESLPGPAVQLLRRLELPAPRDGGPHERISGVYSCWGGVMGRQDAINAPGGGDWRLDRCRFDQDLRRAALASGAAEVRDAVATVKRDGTAWRVNTAGGESLHAETLIDATGRRALLARRMGVRQHGDEPCVAVWAVGDRLGGAHGSQTLLESSDDGWWYGAYLPDGRPMAIYHCRPSTAARLEKAPQEWWGLLSRTELLANYLPPRLFHGTKVHCTDARGLGLDTVCGEGWFACGDAAISFNPLASQGLFNAIASAAMVAKSIDSPEATQACVRYQAHITSVRENYLRQWTELERQRHAKPLLREAAGILA